MGASFYNNGEIVIVLLFEEKGEGFRVRVSEDRGVQDRPLGTRIRLIGMRGVSFKEAGEVLSDIVDRTFIQICKVVNRLKIV